MARIVLLSLAGAIIFAGFGAPFFLSGSVGVFTGGVMVVGGSIAMLLVARKSRKYLDNDTEWNRVMKADGDSLLEGDEEQ
jgi:NADH:ubiquinone oxidoreductase subunit 6 (subunit J)